MRRIFLAGACTLLMTTMALALSGEEGIQRLQQRMAAVSRVSGIVSITYESGETMTGAFVYSRPNKLNIKFSNPAGKQLITNGRKLWVYNPVSKICGVQDLDQAVSGGLGAMVAGYPSIITPRGDGYTLKLKDEGKHYQEINIALTRDFFPERIMFRTADGREFTIVLTNLNFSPTVIDSIFDFNVPSNCQVVKNPLNVK